MSGRNALPAKPTPMRRCDLRQRWPRNGRGAPGRPWSTSCPLGIAVAVLAVFGPLGSARAHAAGQPVQPTPAMVVNNPVVAGLPVASSTPTSTPPPLPQGTQFSTLRTYLTHQQSLVNQLDDRVRGLEQRYHPKRLEDIERRLASVDAKLDQIMPALERRFDKLAEALSAHEHKSSVAREQQRHRADTVHDRIATLELRAGDIQEQTRELRGLRAAVDQVGAGLNSTYARLANVSSAVEVLGHHLRGDQDDAQAEGAVACSAARVASDVETATKSIKQHVDTKADIMSSKVSNLYNDMWRRVNALENLVKSGVSVGNATRRDVLELRVLVQGQGQAHQARQTATQRPKPPSGNLEMALETLERDLQQRLNEVERTLYDQVTNVQVTQDIFLRTCDRLDDKGEELEEKISKVMDRLIDMVVRQDKDLLETHRLLKSHNHQVTRALANATEGGRHLHSTIISLSEQTSEDSKRVESLVRRVLNVQLNETVALEAVSSALQNVSDRVAGAAPVPVGCSSNTGASDEEAWSALLQQANETTSHLQDQAVGPGPDPVTSHESQPTPELVPSDIDQPAEQTKNRTDSQRLEESPLVMVIHGLQRLADTYSAQPQKNKTFEQFINEILPQTPSVSHVSKGSTVDLTTLEDEDYLTNDNQDETDYSF